jgi:DNA polymerase IV
MKMNDCYNPETPLVMHIDLNSCFATVEQQARPMLRNRPVAIVNRRTEHTMIVTASYEAKKMGVTLGTKLKDAKKMCPELVGLESDPAKYRFVYHKLMDIMRDYSAHVTMKSIDEGIIDFHQATDAMKARGLESIGHEIKQRLRDEIGCAMRCNIGIATNRFLAKTAASLHKPDGLDVITSENLRQTLGTLQLIDLTGIASHNEHRLNSIGIYTPLEFLDADSKTLHDMVFKSICGEQWHQRLRGWEVDDVDHSLKSAGRQYVLESRSLSYQKILQRLHHLCESTGQKIRSQSKVARGVMVWVTTYGDGVVREQNGGWETRRGSRYWHARRMASMPFFSDQAIYAQAEQLFRGAPSNIRAIGVTVYEISDDNDPQLSLFGDELARERKITGAIDEINNRYGTRVIHSADTLGTGDFVKQKIPFGSTRYL